MSTVAPISSRGYAADFLTAALGRSSPSITTTTVYTRTYYYLMYSNTLYCNIVGNSTHGGGPGFLEIFATLRPRSGPYTATTTPPTETFLAVPVGELRRDRLIDR